jgi:hypothetical protein
MMSLNQYCHLDQSAWQQSDLSGLVSPFLSFKFNDKAKSEKLSMWPIFTAKSADSIAPLLKLTIAVSLAFVMGLNQYCHLD